MSSSNLSQNILNFASLDTVLLSPGLKVLEWSEGAQAYTEKNLERGHSVMEYFPELFGLEEQLEAVLSGRADSFSIQKISREVGNGEQLFFSMGVVGQEDSRKGEKHLLCLLKNITLEVTLAEKTGEFQALVEEQSRKLAEQERELAQLKQARTVFLGIASHELRAPLSSARSFLELVQDEEAENLNPKLRNFLRLAMDNLNRVLNLANDLLDVERLESGVLYIDRTSFDLARLARVVIDNFKIELERRNLTIEFEDASGEGNKSYRVYADMGRIEQVLTNLISNAIKYSYPGGGRIILKFEERGDRVVLHIRDEGIGIDENDQTQLFQRFFRASNAGSQGARGNGLGLSIVKAIVERHGGEVWVASVLTRGSTFSFSLPLSETGSE